MDILVLRTTIEMDTEIMNHDDLIKSAPMLVKDAAPLLAAIPFTALAKRILGPAVDEVGEMARDRVRLYRYGRQLACVDKAAKMAEDAGFCPARFHPRYYSLC